MAARTIHVDIVSAEGEIFSGPAEIVFVPAKEGELGITPRHAPLLTLLKAGEVRIKTAEGEQSVRELEDLLSLRQPTVSQQLARLRGDGLLSARREGKAIYYNLASDEARVIIGAVYEVFCRLQRKR